MKIISWFKSLLMPDIPDSKPKIELIKDENGCYIVKAYGSYIISSLTMDKEKAERNFNTCLEASRTNLNKKVILSVDV